MKDWFGAYLKIMYLFLFVSVFCVLGLLHFFFLHFVFTKDAKYAITSHLSQKGMKECGRLLLKKQTKQNKNKNPKPKTCFLTEFQFQR